MRSTIIVHTHTDTHTVIPVVGIGGSGFTGVTGGVICVHHTHAESYAQ